MHSRLETLDRAQVWHPLAKGFFEHRLRNDEYFEEKVDYVLQNPVRAGLAADRKDWPFTLLEQR